MQRVAQVRAVAGEGLAGDRYRVDAGYWSRTGWDVCQVTLIRGEDLEWIERTTGARVLDGQHRRNLVTRGIDLEALDGKRFRVGEVELAYDRPRPPCRYIAGLTEPGMTEALSEGRGGICATIITSGTIREGDAVVVA